MEAPYNYFAAYLDGCSVVINHADGQSPWLAALCDDLQQGGTFPHACANTSHPGDVLCIPRGHAHQARASKTQRTATNVAATNSLACPSFHVAVALATQDLWGASHAIRHGMMHYHSG